MNTGYPQPEQLPPSATSITSTAPSPTDTHPARLAAMHAQCRTRGGDGCPCRFDFMCQCPTAELVARLEAERQEAMRRKAEMRGRAANRRKQR